MDPSELASVWKDLETRWEDESAHRAFLDRFSDLEGLAEAGRCYRAALDQRPGDPVALRWRDEVVKKATALALAQLPRTNPPRQMSPTARRWLLAAMVTVGFAMAGWILSRFSSTMRP